MVAIGPWTKGMNNRAEDHALPMSTREDPGDSCRNAVNVDFDNTGKGKRRKGMTKVYSATMPKGGFSCPAGMFFVESGMLKKFTGSSAVDLCPVAGDVFAYEYHNGIVYFSEGLVCKKIVSGVAKNWGMTPPAAPLVYSVSGSYGGGTYLAAVSFVDSAGVESGASPIVSVEAPDGSGIVFSSLPIATDQQVAYLRLYLSMPNGSELYHVADVAPGSAPYTLSVGRYDDSNILELAFIFPPPPGRIIRFYNGRAYVADDLGNFWYSEPFSYDHFRLGSSFEQFPAALSIMEPVTGGIFCATDAETWFYSGTPEDGFSVVKKFEYGAIFGTGKRIPNSDDVAWQSQRGMVIGTADGACKNVQEKHVSPDSAISGAAIIREQDGVRQYIASLHNPTISRFAAKSWLTTEIIRRG